MDHPFQIGKSYRNRDGIYEVLEIVEPKMRVRYEDGRQAILTIDTQARIWQALKDEAQIAQQSPAGSTSGRRKRRRTTRHGYEFDGLQESDFKNNVTGTHWRSRPSLGGRLAQHLSETTPHEFQSHSIYRRPSVYLYMPDYYDPDNGVPYAKYELRLSPEGAMYGFYVERADQSRVMDSTWHWRPFLSALETNVQLQEQLLQAMQEHDLYWLLQIEEGQGDHWSIVDETKVKAGTDWPEFTRRLRAVPAEKWLNVHLCRWMDKAAAIHDGERFAQRVTAVFRAILPLYLASTGADRVVSD